MKLEKTLSESKDTLRTGCCQDCQRSSQRWKNEVEMKAKPNAAEVKETSRAKSIWHVESNQIATVLNRHPSVQDPGAQARQKQKRTRVQQA